MATIDMVLNMAKRTGNASVAGTDRAYSNGGSRKDKHGNGMPSVESMVGATQFIYHGSRQGKELL